MKTPIIVVNFKAYEKSTGWNAEVLSKLCEKISFETGKTIVVAVQEADIYRVATEVKIPVFAQHIDPVEFGAHTGSILAEDVKENGAVGTLLNHAERRISPEVIEKSIRRAKEVGLITIVCAPTPELAEKIASFNPDFIAIEPPELIGGDVSVSTAEPEIITGTIKKVHSVAKIPVLCGAGIKNKNDVERAIRLGAKGILLASGVTKSDNPEKVLRELVNGLNG